MPGTTKRTGVAVVADYARATGTLLPIKPGSEPAGKVPRGIAEQLGLRSSEERGKLGASEPEVEKLNNNLVVLHDVPCIHALIVRVPYCKSQHSDGGICTIILANEGTQFQQERWLIWLVELDEQQTDEDRENRKPPG
jgi:hypothetical protein